LERILFDQEKNNLNHRRKSKGQPNKIQTSLSAAQSLTKGRLAKLERTRWRALPDTTGNIAVGLDTSAIP